jgi:dynein heavy chain
MGSVREEVAARGLPETKEACWAAYVARCRSNLHVVLAMSPVGELLRTRCRNFPGAGRAGHSGCLSEPSTMLRECSGIGCPIVPSTPAAAPAPARAGMVNNTVIDWFEPWPQQALHSVASVFLQDLPLPGELREGGQPAALATAHLPAQQTAR